ncbi:MAG: hypothetical protein DELT_00480 [Desulfovibrio sp.]
MRPAFTVLRIQKLKTWGAVAGAGKHNQRERETPNADSTRGVSNEYLVGTPGMDNVAAVKEAIGTQLIRKNAVLGVEMLLSASPGYFRPNNPERAGAYDQGRLLSWKQATMEWLNEKYGQRVVSAILHLDEATPHIHALLVPVDDNGKLNCRALFGGTRHTLSRLQTEYGNAVADLGINRGIENSRATHQKVSQFYTLTQGQTAPQIPLAQRYSSPEMPNKLSRMSDEHLKQYAREAAISGAKAQQAVVGELVAAVQSKNSLLEREILQLKQANSRLSRETAKLQKQRDALRGVELGPVLSKLFQAKGPYKKEEQQYYLLPDKREVFIDEKRWKIPGVQRGKGAIDLVMALRGYPQDSLHKAVGELAGHFGEEKITGEYAAAMLQKASFEVAVAAKKYIRAKERNRDAEELRR